MALTLTYPKGAGNFPRSYIKGFVGVVSYDMFIVGNELHLDRASSGDVFVFWITDRFLAASSNVYSLDYVFDPALSYWTRFGVALPNTIPITLTSDPNDFSFRIAIAEGVNTDFTVIANLSPPAPSYWLPR